MNVGFLGLGKLGLPCALAIESRGHEVLGYDISQQVQKIIETKRIPYREIGAQKLLEKSKIEIVGIPELVEHSEIIFVPIQTPHDPQYEGATKLPETRKDFDYTYLKAGIQELSNEIGKQSRDKVVIVISTVLPGTIRREIIPLLNEHVKLCYNPYFIAMGTTVGDFLYPEFFLFGVDDEGAARKAEEFYRTINPGSPFYKTTIENAELIKVAYNTFIGMKIVFANTLMEICEFTGADVDDVTDALKLATDRIISPKYLSGGMGDGGGCHCRDNIALSWLARELGLSYDIFESLMIAREKQTEWLAKWMMDLKWESLPKYILGKAYKPETNLDIGSPSILLKNILEEWGEEVICWDPYIDKQEPEFNKGIYLIGTKHEDFKTFHFPLGSTVLDPWGYIPNQKGIDVIRIGRSHEI